MKYIFLFLLSFSAHAGFINIEKCLSGGGDIFSDKQLCQQETNGECAEYPGGNCAQFDSVEIIGDFKDQPIYSAPDEVEACLGQDACREILMIKKCVDGVPYINEDYTSAYCSKFLGYTQGVIGHSLVPNSNKLAAIAAAKAVEDADKEARKVIRAARIANRETLKAELFALKKSEIDAMSVSQRNGVLFKLLNIVQDLQE